MGGDEDASEENNLVSKDGPAIDSIIKYWFPDYFPLCSTAWCSMFGTKFVAQLFSSKMFYSRTAGNKTKLASL